MTLNYVDSVKTFCCFNRKFFEIRTILNCKYYIISVYLSRCWIDKLRINNADIFSQVFEVYTLESAFVLYLWAYTLDYYKQKMVF